ncbi:MAG: MOSC N-terminal beta barrel domain-containing protein [Nitrospirota bacterium]|nr:MOSC N-terminal beta barrel domain-containing protein [Nitrospirota bacterium]MDE3225554.1 MOSC N-terminal beta barrel domain-containing protein [Nitrospirota bacterium]MDE3244009.1 MOSC N-terminal beta barrel domain-containing protein [Nitrospirota bacterium]
MPTMKVTQIWRYPVKSMAGERLNRALIGPLGIEGDRVVHVEDAHGRLITARTHPRLLGHQARLNASGEPVIGGLLWTKPEVRRDIVDIVGPGARLVRDDSGDRFDVLPLLVATDGAIAAFGHDGRRLRPNLVIGGVEGLAERSWPGQCLRIGEVLIGIQDLRGRCVMTTFDPDTQEQDHRVLAGIVRKFGGTLTLNCDVIQGGEIRVGDAVELVRDHDCAAIRA